jgi:hypothetical protein
LLYLRHVFGVHVANVTARIGDFNKLGHRFLPVSSIARSRSHSPRSPERRILLRHAVRTTRLSGPAKTGSVSHVGLRSKGSDVLWRRNLAPINRTCESGVIKTVAAADYSGGMKGGATSRSWTSVYLHCGHS